MSLMTMRRKMASKQTATFILWLLIVVFLVGIFLWNVPRTPTNASSKGGGLFSSSETVATVNGEKIPSKEIEDEFDKELQQPQGRATISNTLDMRKPIFDNAVKNRVISQTLKSLNIHSDTRYAEQIAREYALQQLADLHKQAEATYKANQTDKKKPAAEKAKTVDQLYADSIAQFMKEQGEKDVKNPSDNLFTDWFVKSLTGGKDPAMTQRFMAHAQTRQIGEAKVKELPIDPFTPDYVQKVMTKDVHAHWIFIAAKDVTPAGMKAAEDKINKLRDEIIKNPSTFEAVAKKESDHPASRIDGGDLSWLTPGGATMMFLPVMAEYMAFSQKPKEIGPVYPIVHLNRNISKQNKFGYAFLRVDEIRTQLDLSKTFDFAKEQTVDILKTKQRYLTELGEAALTFQQKSAVVLCNTPEFKGYWDELNENYAEADKDYKQALKETAQHPLRPEVEAAISYKVALSTPVLKDKIPLLKAALPYADTLMSKLFMDLGAAYESTGDKKSAIEQYNYASDSASDNDVGLRSDLQTKFTKLGDKDDAQKMVKWLDDHKAAAAKLPPARPNFATPPIPSGK